MRLVRGSEKYTEPNQYPILQHDSNGNVEYNRHTNTATLRIADKNLKNEIREISKEHTERLHTPKIVVATQMACQKTHS